MSSTVEESGFRFDGMKWLVVIALVGGGAFANSYYSGEFDLIYRVLAMLVVGLLAAYVAVNTAKGNAFWTLVKEAQVEVKKVVWPTPAETNQTALLVTVVVIIAALILWLFDWLIGQVAKFIIG